MWVAVPAVMDSLTFSAGGLSAVPTLWWLSCAVHFLMVSLPWPGLRQASPHSAVLLLSWAQVFGELTCHRGDGPGPWNLKTLSHGCKLSRNVSKQAGPVASLPLCCGHTPLSGSS